VVAAPTRSFTRSASSPLTVAIAYPFGGRTNQKLLSIVSTGLIVVDEMKNFCVHGPLRV
jgi:hypothetical protein